MAAVRIVLELVVVVADRDTGGRDGALNPVIPGAANRLTQARAHVDDVVAKAAEVFRQVVAGHDEVVAIVALQQVERTGAAADGVVARSTLHDVVAKGVGEDVITGAADVLVVARAAFHHVVAAVAAHRVVTFAREHAIPVAVVAAVEDHMFRSGVANRAVRHPDEQEPLVVPGGGRVVDNPASPSGEDAIRIAGQLLRRHVEHKPGSREHVRGRTEQGRVARDQLAERIGLEL